VIAALYVESGGVYYGLEGVDPWDEARDARRYDGPYPVVAHPPCERWSRMAPLVESLGGRRFGDDGGTFEHALDQVRRHGGVLEHPAASYAWARFGLQRPAHGFWTQSLFDDGYVTEISQVAYGHQARKPTWLYYVGPPPPPLDWSIPAWTHYTSKPRKGTSNYDAMPELPRDGRHLTPPAFRDELLRLARAAFPLAVAA
jgi:hypothetical protein